RPLRARNRDRTRTVVTGGSAIRILDATGAELDVFPHHKAPVRYLNMSADGRFVISVDAAYEVKVWETDTRRTILESSWANHFPKKAPAVFSQSVNPAAASVFAEFSPDGWRLAATLPDGGVKAWD